MKLLKMIWEFVILMKWQMIYLIGVLKICYLMSMLCETTAMGNSYYFKYYDFMDFNNICKALMIYW